MHLILSNSGLRPNSRLTEALCVFLSTSLWGLIGRSEIGFYNYIFADVLATRMSRHNQTLSGNDSPQGENKRNSVESVSATGKKGGEHGWNDDLEVCKSEGEKVWEWHQTQIPFQREKERRCERKGAKNPMSSAYSRHSRTLAPGAPLIVGLDVRLHPVLHHAADGARHHVSAPVSVTQNRKTT